MTTGLTLIQHVWDNAPRKAWETLNHSMSKALDLAIGSGMEFAAADLNLINKTMRTSYWMGQYGWEPSYAFAIAVGNNSFIAAFEGWTGRKPFFGNNVETINAEGFIHRTMGCQRKRERMAIFSRMPEGKVTSITNDHIILCTYEVAEYGESLKTRKKLNHEQVAAMFPAPKKLKEDK